MKKLNIYTIKVGDSAVLTSPIVNYLGVIFDSHLNKEQQVSALCKSCGHQIYMIGKIVKFLTPRATEQIVHSFVTSILNNWTWNSLLFGLPNKLINRLQLLQHRAARLSVMRSLHWLPVRSRIILNSCFRYVNSFMGWYQRTSLNL